MTYDPSRCQCNRFEDRARCHCTMTQEDLLCDTCRGTCNGAIGYGSQMYHVQLTDLEFSLLRQQQAKGTR